MLILWGVKGLALERAVDCRMEAAGGSWLVAKSNIHLKTELITVDREWFY